MLKACGLILSIIVFAGCNQLQYVNFNVKTPGITNGVFVVRNDTGAMIYSVNIKNQAVKLDHQVLEQGGYYTLNISNSDKPMPELKFEVYLEPGQYDITINAADPNIYPKIKSASAMQQELSDYYGLVTNIKSQRQQEYTNNNKRINSKESSLLAKDAFNQLVKNENTLRDKLSNTEKDALIEFVKTHPKSVAAAHIMTGIDYQADPVFYYDVYQRLSPEAKKSDDGVNLGTKLSALVKLAPGHEAPAISGTTPDGKPFDPAALKGKKLYLVELWKAANQQSRIAHAPTSVANMLQIIADKSNFGMISISLDHKRDWWTGAIADDHMTWPQYSDLQGNESVNTVNWGVTHLPTYFLVDANWHMVEKGLQWSEVPVAVNQYLLHH